MKILSLLSFILLILKNKLSNKLYNIFEFHVEDYETFYGKYQIMSIDSLDI